MSLVKCSECGLEISDKSKNCVHCGCPVKREEVKIITNKNLFLFITNFQNEVHNTAIEYHRKLREKDINKSELDSINGIGQKKKELLLKEFKTIDNIREADVNDLLKVKGITFDLAKKIKDKIN